jgi:ribosomal 30S subunit maturation factor RimM
VRLTGIGDRESAAALNGEPLLVDVPDEPLGEDEWRVDDLVGLRVEGIGEVVRVLNGPSCDVLEIGPDGVLVPLVRDAVRRVDPAAGVIEINREFLGL